MTDNIITIDKTDSFIAELTNSDIQKKNFFHILELYAHIRIQTPFPKDTEASIKAIIEHWRKDKDNASLADFAEDYYLKGKSKEKIIEDRNLRQKAAYYLLWDVEREFARFKDTYLKYGMECIHSRDDEVLNFTDIPKGLIFDLIIFNHACTIKELSYYTKEQLIKSCTGIGKKRAKMLEDMLHKYGYSFSAEEMTKQQRRELGLKEDLLNEGYNIDYYVKNTDYNMYLVSKMRNGLAYSDVSMGNVMHLAELYYYFCPHVCLMVFPKDAVESVQAVIDSWDKNGQKSGIGIIAEEYFINGKDINEIVNEKNIPKDKALRGLEISRQKLQIYTDTYLKNGMEFYHTHNDEAIFMLNISLLLRSTLFNGGIHTVKELSYYTKQQVKETLKLSNEAVDTLKNVLNDYGYEFSTKTMSPSEIYRRIKNAEKANKGLYIEEYLRIINELQKINQ